MDDLNTQPRNSIDILKMLHEESASFSTSATVLNDTTYGSPLKADSEHTKEYSLNQLPGAVQEILLREHVNALSDWLEQFSQPFLAFSSDGSIISCGTAFSSLLGFSKDELVGRDYFNLSAPKFRQLDVEIIAKLRSTHKPQYFEKEYRRRDGSTLPVAVLLQEVVDDQGHTNYLCAFSHDISERKRAEEALEIERQQLLSMFDSIDEPIYVSDPDTFEILYINQVLRNKLGSVSGKKCYSAMQGLDGPCPFCTNSQIFGDNLGREHTWEMRNRVNNRWYRCIDKAIRWPNGKMVRYEMAVDITDRRRADEELRLSVDKLRRTLDGAVQALATTAERRDPYTAGHQVRVTQLACAIAEELGLPPGMIDGLRVSATLHDLGKIYVPAEILNKPGPISSIEFGMIKAHPKVGFEIIKNVEFPWPVAQIVLQHHERINGLGYPQRLRGHQILLEARILGVADVVEAMASHRPYRPALSIEEAIKEITKNKGVLYDPDVVDTCVKLFEETRFDFTPV